jgi:hypothetical protein
MSDLKVDGIIASTGTNTALTLQGKGTGKVAIGDGALLFPDADGSDGQFIKTDGSAALSFAAAAGGSWNFIGTATASTSASIGVTGLDATYDMYAIGISEIRPTTDGSPLTLQLGDSSGYDSGSSDYLYVTSYLVASDGSSTEAYEGDLANTDIELAREGVSTDDDASVGGMLWLPFPQDTDHKAFVTGRTFSIDTNPQYSVNSIGGVRLADIVFDRVQILFETGNIASGRLTVWGIAHA